MVRIQQPRLVMAGEKVKVLIGLLIGLIAGWWLGWGHAHAVVAAECERLGGFFVGNKVFRCVETSGQVFDDKEPSKKIDKPP